MSRRVALSLVALALAASPTHAAAVIVPLAEIGPQDAPRLDVVSSASDRLEIVFEVGSLATEALALDGREFQSLSIPGGGIAGEPGDPGIPVFSRLIALPEGSGVTVSAVLEDVEEIGGIDVSPVRSDESAPVTRSLDAYAREGFGDDPAVEVGEPGLLRGLRVAAVTFRPVQYDPATRTLRVAHRVRAEVRFTGTDARNAKAVRDVPMTPSFDKICEALVVNYESVRKSDSIQNGTWLLITPNSADVTSRVQALVDWRKRKGTPAILATTASTGTTKEQIKAYIQNAYNTWPNPPEYVCLVGDASGTYSLPTWNDASFGGEGDFPYIQLDGGDLFPDAHIGRLSIGSTQDLDAIVLKQVGYERTPYLTDPGWYTRACLTGDPGSSGYSCVQIMQWIKTGLFSEKSYTQVDTVFTDPFVSGMATALNRGDTFFAYRGYLGMSGWSNSNTYALTNGWKMPFATVFTCGTGSFAGSTALSEGFLRAGSGATAAARGAVGAVGIATLSTHTRFNNALMFGCYQGMLYEGLTTMGAAVTRAKLELYLNYYTASSNYVTAYHWWVNLMGDPAGEIWTGFPATLSVNHPAQLAAGSNNIIVNVTEVGSPIEGAQVCFWFGTETYVVGVTDAEGRCELPITALNQGTALLTVAKHDKHPYMVPVPVVKAGLFLGYQSSMLDDSAGGNGDDVANPGEEIGLQVQVKNFSSTPATSVTATLTCDDPLVTILDGAETFADVPVDSSRWCADDFNFVIDYAAPDGHVIEFGLEVQAGAQQWHSLLEVTVVSADLVTMGQTLYNHGGNSRLDPGETVQLSVRLRNDGGAAGDAVSAQLRSLSPFVTISDTVAVYGTIPAGGNVENTDDLFTLSADPFAFQGHLAVLQLSTLFSGGSRDTTYVTLQVGQATSDDPLGPDQYGYYAFDNTDLAYAQVPTYAWIELDPALGGTGTEIPLADFGNYQDKSAVVTIPFDFQFYGESYTRATVCSNGWIAMGSTYLTDYRNWTIPGAGAPNNLIAVFWDDLYRSGNAKILQKYDATNHLWIVEWSQMRNMVGNYTETFEVIFYDPDFYPTDSQDGQIVMQYLTVNNTDGTDGYATVGIQNRTHTDGLLYTYFNQYPASAAPLAAGRAIKFVPVQAEPMGVLAGVVLNASAGNAPISGATVRIVESGRTFTTAGDGGYSGGAQEGTYTIIASHPSFAADTSLAVVVQQGQVSTVDFYLTDIAGPTITNVTEWFTTTDTSGPYPVSANVSDHSGVSAATLIYRINAGSWIEAPMTESAGVYSAEITGWPSGTEVDYYVRAVDANDFSSSYPAGAPDTYLSLFVTDVSYVYDVEDPEDTNWMVGMPGDGVTSGAWVRADPVGTTYNGQPVQPEDDHTASPGTLCFVTGNGAVGGAPGDADVDGGGCTSLRSPIFDLSGATKAFVHYWRWFGENGNSSDDEFGIDISNDGGNTWVEMEHVLDNEALWTGVSLDITTLIPLTNQMAIRFQACDLGVPGLIEAAVDDFSIEVFIPNTIDVPVVTGPPMPLRLEQSRPNPFTTRAAINFSLPAAGMVKLYVYDVQGRAVRRLVDGSRPAGAQVVFWDGRDNRGRTTPSGIYFYRLVTPAGTQVMKLVRAD